MSGKITVALGIKGPRDPNIFARSYATLLGQTHRPGIVLVSYNDTDEYFDTLFHLLQEQDTLLRYHDGTDEWREGKALNVGIRAAKTPYVMTTNTDLLFDKDFIKIVVEKLEKADHAKKDKLLTCQRWNLDVDGERIKPIKDHVYFGTLLAAKREFWEHIRGYDERYVGWGRVDHDITNRARLAGVVVENITPAIHAPEHIWHKPQKNTEEVKNLNFKIFYDDKTVQRNDGGWGKL